MTLSTPLRKIATKLIAKFGSAAIEVSTETTDDTTVNCVLQAGDSIKGVFTSVTLTSGKAIAYKI